MIPDFENDWDAEANPKFELNMWVVWYGCWIGNTPQREVRGYGKITHRKWDELYGTHRYTIEFLNGSGSLKGIYQADLERYYMTPSVTAAYLRSVRNNGRGK